MLASFELTPTAPLWTTSSADARLLLAWQAGVPEGAGAHRALPHGWAYRARPALACIIGARRAWTVEMISSVSMPWR